MTFKKEIKLKRKNSIFEGLKDNWHCPICGERCLYSLNYAKNICKHPRFPYYCVQCKVSFRFKASLKNYDGYEVEVSTNYERR